MGVAGICTMLIDGTAKIGRHHAAVSQRSVICFAKAARIERSPNDMSDSRLSHITRGGFGSFAHPFGFSGG
jgi:hypothetical protein